ncbi:MAG: restriction endonuclease subunit S [Candidatus Ozemobacteraceae bacterium]
MMQKQELPSGWRKQKLADLANVKGGKRLPKGRSLVSENTGYPYIRVTDMHDGGVSLENVLFIPQDIVAKISRYRIFTEDIFITVAGTLGVVGEIPQELNGANLTENADRITDINCDKKFLLQVLRSSFIQGIIKSTQTQNAQPKLAIERINTFPILLPPQPEQKAIADLLSTWDEAIEKTERLIQAKEKRFKQLLNDLIHQGRSNHTWKGYNLSDLCSPVSRKNGENNTNVLTSSAQNGLVSQIEYYNKSVSAENVTGYYLLKKGEFAYNRSSAKGYPYGATKRLDRYEKGVLSTLYLCFALKPDAPCESDFLLHLFESGAANRELRAVCQEGARSHGLLNITKADFFGIKLFLPSQDQQKKIQSALNTAQNEIALLKQLAEKYKTQKRGLMQKMLTGEWRVRGFATNDEG